MKISEDLSTLGIPKNTSTPILTSLSPTGQARQDAEHNKFPELIDGKDEQNKEELYDVSGLVREGLGWVLPKTK